MTDDKFDELEEMVMDSTKVAAIFDAAKMSMGKVFNLMGTHLVPMKSFSSLI